MMGTMSLYVCPQETLPSMSTHAGGRSGIPPPLLTWAQRGGRCGNIDQPAPPG